MRTSSVKGIASCHNFDTLNTLGSTSPPFLSFLKIELLDKYNQVVVREKKDNKYIELRPQDDRAWPVLRSLFHRHGRRVVRLYGPETWCSSGSHRWEARGRRRCACSTYALTTTHLPAVWLREQEAHADGRTCGGRTQEVDGDDVDALIVYKTATARFQVVAAVASRTCRRVPCTGRPDRTSPKLGTHAEGLCWRYIRAGCAGVSAVHTCAKSATNLSLRDKRLRGYLREKEIFCIVSINSIVKTHVSVSPKETILFP